MLVYFYYFQKWMRSAFLNYPYNFKEKGQNNEEALFYQ